MAEDQFEAYMRKAFSVRQMEHQADQQLIAQLKGELAQAQEEIKRLRERLHRASRLLDEQTGSVPAVNLAGAFDERLLENPFPDGFLNDRPGRGTSELPLTVFKE